jgi:serine/threonine-protein kinase
MSREIDRLRSALTDRYAVERELGRGGMATVYLAQDLKHSRQVAIKVLLPEIAATLGTKRFLVEIETAARLNHPHILPLYDSGEVDDFVYYVMPYVEGESLRERLERDRQLVIEEALTIAREVADALSYAHAQGVVHRDIKPENILISAGHAVLADFGIARAISEAGDERLTGTGMVLGSPEYMSPEQATGGTLDGRADIYALGCVLYEMLSGEPPFVGRTPQAILARRVTEAPPSVRAMRETVPLRIDETVRQALARVPADRFDTATSMVEALRTPTGVEEAIEVDSRTVLGKGPSRRLLVRVVGAVGATLAAAAIVFYALRLGTSPATALEATRVMIFPAQTPAAIAGMVGEEIATMIGYALDGAGGMRAIDGWTFLDADEREDIRSVTDDRMRELAESRRSAFAVTGRLMIAGSDSVAVLLYLWDVAGDAMLRQARVEGPLGEAWRPGLAAINQLLPAMIEGAPPQIDAAFNERDPGAIATFLRGEAGFRRARFAQAVPMYQAAVEADPEFGLAAIRGAQAAAWNDDLEEAGALARVALTRSLPERYTALARGMVAYVEGDAETAIGELESALALDDEFAFAWIQLGEVYTHLVVRRTRPDSLADDAFARAQMLDSTAVNALFHRLEYRLRHGDVEGADPLLQRFNAANPDEGLARHIALMDQCVREGPDARAWERAALETPLNAVTASFALAVGGGYQLPCAETGFRAILAADTTRHVGRVWSATKGVLATLVAQGRDADAVGFLDATIESGYPFPERFWPVLGLLGVEVGDRASDLVRRRLEQLEQTGPQGGASPRFLWYAGVWRAGAGDTAAVARVARAMEEYAARTERAFDSLVLARPLEAVQAAAEARRDRLLARAMGAHLSLARGDSLEALRQFRALRPNAPRSGPVGFDLNWDELEPLALEHLRLAELLLANGEAHEALDVAGVFDSPEALIYVLYLRASLDLRARAAEALGLQSAADAFRARLDAMRRQATR